MEVKKGKYLGFPVCLSDNESDKIIEIGTTSQQVQEKFLISNPTILYHTKCVIGKYRTNQMHS